MRESTPLVAIITTLEGTHNVVLSCAHGIREGVSATLRPQDAIRATDHTECGVERIEYYWATHEARLAALDSVGPYFGIEALAALMVDRFRPVECECDPLPGVAWENGTIGPVSQHAEDCPAQPQQPPRFTPLTSEVKE